MLKDHPFRAQSLQPAGQSRTPSLRKLGYDLLEHWGVLQPLRTLGPDDRRRLLSALLALYDLGATTWTEHELSERGFDVEAFAGHGFVEPAGRLRDLLIDEDDGSPEVVQVGAGIGETGEFEDFGGRPAWVPKTLVQDVPREHGLGSGNGAQRAPAGALSSFGQGG